MKKETYTEIMNMLDVVETEMNNIAKAVGHVSYEEFFAAQEKKAA
jgi:hypothetical protein